MSDTAEFVAYARPNPIPSQIGWRWQECKLRNLTPHQVMLYRPNGSILMLDPESPTLRAKVRWTELAKLQVGCGVIPVVTSTLLPDVPDLPPAVPGTWLVVSRVVAESVPERTDLLYPDRLVRDLEGKVIGARALGASRWPKPA